MRELVDLAKVAAVSQLVKIKEQLKAMKENKVLELTFNQQGKKRIKFLKVIKLLVSNT